MDEEEGEVENAEEDSPKEDNEKDKVSRTSKSSKNSKSSKGSKGSKSSFASKNQHLFLVEFLVDTVTIDSCSVDEEILQGQTCLSLTFLNFPPMEICEKDFDPNRELGATKVKFNCGKSLMFAFNEHQCDFPPPLSVEITVSKKLGDDTNPFKVDIGTIKICVSELFRQIVDIAKYKPDKLPTSKAIKDCFMLIGPGKRTMGEVSVYIRLSCLGQNVVTEFQCGPDMKTNPVLFKNREGKKVFEVMGNGRDRECGGNAQGALSESRGKGMVGNVGGGGGGVGGFGGMMGNGGGMGGGCNGGLSGGTKGKIGCGCIRPPSNPTRGGQGDAERTGPPVSGAYTQGNKVVLDIPAKSNNKPGGNSGDCCRGKQNCCSSSPGGMSVATVNKNPDQNCFILKVGDKGQIPDRGKMILEFRTPKQRILPKNLPPYHEDIAVQTDSPKKGKGKGKKK